MAGRTLSNLGLKAFFLFGEDGWNDAVDTNFLKLSVLVQAGAIGMVTALPGSPVAGDVYIVGSAATSNPNTIAVYDNNSWKYFAPQKGWSVYNRSNDSYVMWSGTDWTVLSLAKLRSISALDSSLGLIEQTGDNSFAKRAIGVGSANAILSRADGDLRFANISHSHPASGVTSFNTRDGAVTLTAGDISAALDGVNMTNITSLGSLADNITGLIEKTGAGTFGTRVVGSNNPAAIPTLAQADGRYAPFSLNLTGLAMIPSNGRGLVEMTADNTFAMRAIGSTNNSDILTRGAADAIYVAQGSANNSYRVSSIPTPNAIPSAELLFDHIAIQDCTIPADLVGSQCAVSTTPLADWTAELQLNDTTVATITVQPSGSIVMATVLHTQKLVLAGDTLTLVAPVSTDSAIRRFRFTLNATV
jgi:hypothetical protein